MAAGQIPDIFIFNPDPTSFQYYEGDGLLDFTDDLKGSWGNDFVDGTVAGATKNGRTKSVPYEIALTPIWYNSALFEKAGVRKFPTTMDEFVVACDKLLAQGQGQDSDVAAAIRAAAGMQ